ANEASNVNALAVGGTRLLAMGGANGTVLFRDTGAGGWTVSELGNIGLRPGVQGFSAAFTGSGWVVGTTSGVFRSVLGQEPGTVSVPGDGGPAGLRFALAGAQPVGDIVRFQFELPEPGRASIEVFDIAGRRAAEPVRVSWSAGTHEVSWDARSLDPGIYEAR